MKKFIIISILVIGILIFGFILPPIFFPPSKLGREFSRIYREPIRPINVIFVTAKIITNQNNEYENHCKTGFEQALLQNYTWMMIRGPIVEVCFNRDEQGEVYDWNYAEIAKKRR